MKLIQSLMERRQFLAAFLSSVIALVLGRVSKAFDLLFHRGVARAANIPASTGRTVLKGIVVYYSATGNTAQVADALWRGMKSVIACDVAPMEKMNPEDMSRYDVVAIGCPNWYFRIPANVLVFTHDMPLMEGKHCVVFGTHGGMPYGQYWMLSRNILKKNMTIIGWGDWYGSDFITPHERVPDEEWGHPDDIDLREAEAFGKKMAEYSLRIYGGETELIPEIPKPEFGQNSLWSPASHGTDKISFAGGERNGTPRFDLTKCIYPRCTRCIENCPVNAIDFSMITPTAWISERDSDALPLVLKEACQQCGGVCERVCLYDAIIYVGEKGDKSYNKINMSKCTYPKCTICLDHCPQDAIDFSESPPVFHNWCEGESLCWAVCPEDAIEIPSMAGPGEGGVKGPGQGPMAGGETGPEAGVGMGMPHSTSFRPLIREEDVGSKGRVKDITNYPRLIINKNFWPYNMEKG